MATNRKKGIDPSSLGSIVRQTESAHEVLRNAREILIDRIHPNPDQPRKAFDPGALNELKASIEVHGVMEPILVRPDAEDRYQIICGERRYRACVELKRPTIPAVIHKVDELTALRMAYDENLKRQDLSAIEEARFMHSLLARGLVKSNDELAKALGVGKSRVSQQLVILKLPDAIQEEFSKHAFLGELHARSLHRVKDDAAQRRLMNKIVDGQLSGRMTENLTKQLQDKPDPLPRAKAVSFGDVKIKREADGYSIHVKDGSADDVAALLVKLAQALREKKTQLPIIPDENDG